ncbi:14964_t:CDS:2, partial [Gigaspora rosea]
IKQWDFKIDSRLESGYYLSFLEYFKNEHREESEFLIKQYKIIKNCVSSTKIKVWWDVISGNDVEELRLVLDTALNLKDNYCQIEYSKDEKIPLSNRKDLYELFIDRINSIDDDDFKYFE